MTDPRSPQLDASSSAAVRVLGIDPGLQITGYALMDLKRGALEPVLVEAGVFRFNPKRPLEERLGQLHTDLSELIAEHVPQQVAVEQLYAHYAHPRTAILMGHARGVILQCAAAAGLAVQSLAATEVKKSITGNGHATKEQIQLAVQAQCGLAQPPSPPDVADAIAIALTHGRRLGVSRAVR
ncbi:MAG: crossover junction endodeoxyribonuclease RuvC [Algisphaera sp.]